jgi:hypothetical protein
MEDVLVILGIAFGVGGWALSLFLVQACRRARKPLPAPPAVEPIHKHVCEFCGGRYDHEISWAAFPDRFCSEVCEIAELERTVAR